MSRRESPRPRAEMVDVYSPSVSWTVSFTFERARNVSDGATAVLHRQIELFGRVVSRITLRLNAAADALEN